jgi:hypothetical protein
VRRAVVDGFCVGMRAYDMVSRTVMRGDKSVPRVARCGGKVSRIAKCETAWCPALVGATTVYLASKVAAVGCPVPQSAEVVSSKLSLPVAGCCPAAGGAATLPSVLILRGRPHPCLTKLNDLCQIFGLARKHILVLERNDSSDPITQRVLTERRCSNTPSCKRVRPSERWLA